MTKTYTPAEQATAIKTMLNDFNKSIREFEEVLYSVAGTHWIVEIQGVYVQTIPQSNGQVKYARVDHATRMSKEQAEALALKVRNGNGKQGEAVELTQALNKVITSIRACRNQLIDTMERQGLEF